MYNRMLKLPLTGNQSAFLFGPRGTGKTSWVKFHIPDAIYLDLLEFVLYKDMLANPARLASMIPTRYEGWVVIDEVQRVPELLNEVHRLIESRKVKFLLTGSSARALRKKGVNLLAGRAHHYWMHPLIAQEMGEDFELARAVELGLLPAVWVKEEPEKFLQTYVESYLREEVQQEGLTRNVGAFSRFLEIASFSQGCEVNTSAIAREVGVTRHLIDSYFDIVEDLLIGYRLNPFTKRAKRRLTAHAKFFFFDTGVYRTLRPMGPLDKPEEADGAALETLFLQSVRAINDYQNLEYEIYYWRTATGLEVDFVMYGKNGIFAFEIKRTKNITSKMLYGLREFKKDYEMATVYLLYLGDKREYHGDVTVIPFEEALRELPKLVNAPA